MAKRYFDQRCGFDGRAFFVRDCSDHELSRLRWDQFARVGENGKEKRQRLRESVGQNSSDDD
jgi:hypothetical protein